MTTLTKKLVAAMPVFFRIAHTKPSTVGAVLVVEKCQGANVVGRIVLAKSYRCGTATRTEYKAIGNGHFKMVESRALSMTEHQVAVRNALKVAAL